MREWNGEGAAERIHQSHSDQGNLAMLGFTQKRRDLTGIGNERAGTLTHQSASQRQSQGADGPIKKAGTGFSFELRDGKRDGRLGKPELARRRRHGASLANCQKDLQRSQIERKIVGFVAHSP